MSKEIKGFIIGIIFSAMISGTVFAVAREIFFGVEVTFNGVAAEFDEDSQPFIMDGRTFLPVRAIADLVGLNVRFIDGVVTLTTDDYTPPPGNDVTFSRGVRGAWEENIYVNEYLGLTFTPPGDWDIATDEEIIALADRGTETLAIDLTDDIWELAGQHFFVDMAINSPRGANVRIYHERLLEIVSAQKYIADIATATSMNAESLPAAAIGNNEWYSFHASREDFHSYVRYFVKIQNNIASVIVITSSDTAESAEEILAMFGLLQHEG